MKRSGPIERRTELHRGTSQLARTPMPRPAFSHDKPKPKSERLRRSEDVLAASKKIVRERDGHRCVRCGEFVPVGFGSVQHRSARGAGGSSHRADVVNVPGNLVLLCGSAVDGCHGYLETTADGKDEGRDAYWILPIGHPDPSSVPVVRFGRWCLIDNDGNVVEHVTPPDM